MLIIHDAAHIVIDAETVSSGDLALTDSVLAPGDREGEPAAEVERLDASGCVVTPGLVNAHHHLMQSAFRTLPGTRGVPMSQWLPTMATGYAAAGVDPELCSVPAAAGAAEGLLCGVTTV